MRRLGVLLLSLVVLMGMANCVSVDRNAVFKIPERISKADRQYLQELAKDTWANIDFMVDRNTQLPYDDSSKSEYTSVSNLGVYIASLTAAVDMNLISREEAETRLDILLSNIDEFWKWNGFTQSWNSVKTGKPAEHDPWISTLDSGNFYAGLKVGRGYFPKLKASFDKLIDPVAWDKMSNPKNHKLLFGYNRKEDKLGGDLNWLGADPRLAYFVAISSGKIPVETWQSLDRNMECRYGYQYLVPGWQGGGLFMQYLAGQIVNERNSFVGLSAANFAFSQILHARKHNYAAWGWSACAAPTGEYLGMNALRDDVVTPHASVLALQHYPSLVISNLKKMESMGARKPYEIDGKKLNFGFRDSISLKTKAVANKYLLLDQCMLFMSLANFLDNGIIWRSFANDKDVLPAYQALADLHPKPLMVKNPKTGAMVEVYELRDTDPKLTTDDFATIAEKNASVRNFVVKEIRETQAHRANKPIVLDGSLDEWNKTTPIILPEDIILKNNLEPSAKCYFMWDKDYLYFAAVVVDTNLSFTKERGDIWKDDAIELFLARRSDAFAWGQPESFQIGMTASGPKGKPQTWAWFQDGETKGGVEVKSQIGDKVADGKPGYVIEARLKWSFLDMEPSSGFVIGASPAVHFVDKEGKQDQKCEWSYMPDGKSLGRLILK